jgi:hypothetical protein
MLDLELRIVGRHCKSCLLKTVVREMAIYRSGLTHYRSSAVGEVTVHGWMTGLDLRQWQVNFLFTAVSIYFLGLALG